jgi:hypothetical protein
MLKRLYDSDAKGLQDTDLCDEVGSYLHARCETFQLVGRGEVLCPECGVAFKVNREGSTSCPTDTCDWLTTFDVYWQSVQNHYAFAGRATQAFDAFYERFPSARSYRDKMLLIDQLIHSFHVDEKSDMPVKSVASKLLEGNKKAVVRFLDELSGVDPSAKDEWRKTTAQTIDARALKTDR